MFRGTTPTITFEVDKEFVLDDLKQIWVTIENKFHEHTYDIDQVTLDAVENTVTVHMTQEDTLAFKLESKLVDQCYAQIRFLKNDGTAYASDEVRLELKRILKEGVIE